MNTSHAQMTFLSHVANTSIGARCGLFLPKMRCFYILSQVQVLVLCGLCVCLYVGYTVSD